MSQIDLFVNPVSHRLPPPRPFQEVAHRELRAGFVQGHKRQLLMAPTGAGKTYIGLRLCAEALAKGKRVVFICDRKTLINQTSAVSEAYGLPPHGVFQADNPRFAPHRPFQIASAQTIGARGLEDNFDVVVVDEAHTLHSPVTELALSTQAAVVGLSATPFTDGLGKIYSRVVNAATMHELTQQGILAPLRVLSCKRIDMAGAKTSGGEWTLKAASERGLAIVGDVVLEWTQHAEDRKTIVFGPTVVHCEELVRQFNATGVHARLFCGTTPDAEREELLAEYRKPDSKIRVLVSVEALAKGFDVPDVGCVVDCRPLRKSLSTFVQLLGRGMRSSPGKDECLLRGTPVLTDCGEVPIQDVTLDHKVWDGVNFVAHAGAVCRGVRPVITYDGLTATPEHEVMTDDGWMRFEEAARWGRRIARTGVDGRHIRLADDFFARSGGLQLEGARSGEVRTMRGRGEVFAAQSDFAPRHAGVSDMQPTQGGEGTAVALRAVPSPDAALHESSQSLVGSVRRPRDSVPVQFGKRGSALGGEGVGDSGSVDGTGPNQQRRTLRTWQPSMGYGGREHEQHDASFAACGVSPVQVGASRDPVCRQDTASNAGGGPLGGGDHAPLGGAVEQAEGEVWDVLSAGPLQRFTANGRLVHNCLLLDHSGNAVRFRDDFSDIYFNGLSELDAGERLDKAVREDDDPEASAKACPSCGASPMGKRCIRCGFEPARVSPIEHAPGRAEELALLVTVEKYAPNQRELYNAIASYKRGRAKPGGNPKGATAHAYRDITGSWPPRSFDYDTAHAEHISDALVRKLRSMTIAYAKRAR